MWGVQKRLREPMQQAVLTLLRRPDNEADLFAVGEKTRQHFAFMEAGRMAVSAGVSMHSQAPFTQFCKLVPKRTNILTCVFYRKMFIGGLNWETTDGELSAFSQ